MYRWYDDVPPQIDKLDKLFPLITQIAYTTGVDAVPPTSAV
jgi:hypothetical protein